MNPSLQTPAQKRAAIRQRLGTYFMGVAIGCMLVVVLLSAKKAFIKPSPAPPNAQGPPAPAPSGAPSPAAPAPSVK